jgi:hypothetical protein
LFTSLIFYLRFKKLNGAYLQDKIRWEQKILAYCCQLSELCGNVDGQQEGGEGFSDFFSDFGKILHDGEGR